MPTPDEKREYTEVVDSIWNIIVLPKMHFAAEMKLILHINAFALWGRQKSYLSCIYLWQENGQKCADLFVKW